ncbi:MAG: hypothetical protein GC168_06070 [Candidatus Hydrogenedens sp.]|nr:hypothetical protein [Candidatus Hydrogenedens sp.]
MASQRNPLLQALLYSLTRTYTGIMGLLQMPAARGITIAIARVALALVPRLHRVGMENLDLAYGDSLTLAEKRRILQDAMDNLAIVAAEFAHGPRMARNGFKDVAEVEGWEHIDQSKGAILISGHLGNWEWFAGAIAVYCPKMLEVVRPLDFPPMNRYVDSTRRATGTETLDKFAAAKELLTRLKEGWCVGVLVDQSPRESGAPTTYFGRDCWTTVAPAMLAARTGCPVHFVTVERRADSTYHIVVQPAMPFQKTRNLMADMQANAQMTQDTLEAFVRQHPGHWLWFHRRWKQRPRLAEEWNKRLKRVEEKNKPAE